MVDIAEGKPSAKSSHVKLTLWRSNRNGSCVTGPGILRLICETLQESMLRFGFTVRSATCELNS